MFLLEYKIKAKQHQYRAIDKAIRTGQFVRNKALRYWLDNKGVNKYDLNKYCRVIAKEYSFASELNSTALKNAHHAVNELKNLFLLALIFVAADIQKIEILQPASEFCKKDYVRRVTSELTLQEICPLGQLAQAYWLTASR